MKRHAKLRQLDPVALADVEAITSRPIFEKLGRSLIDGDITGENSAGVPIETATPRLRHHPLYRRPAALSAVAAVVLLIVGLVVFVGGHGGLTHPVTTSRHTGHSFAVAGKPSTHQAGSWRLVDDLLSGAWQQNTAGPPPGYLDCPSASSCYVMNGRYPNAMAGAPLLSESLYVSSDLGSTWTVLPMPSGFSPTTSLSCGGPTNCAAGGTYNGQPVLVMTNDGGHTFTVDPLPSGVGTLYQLSCPTTQFCGGLAASSVDSNNSPVDATFLSTNNNGASFSDSPIESGDSMGEIDCTTSVNCMVVGTDDALPKNDLTEGVVAQTTNGGQSWTVGTLPGGFGVQYFSVLSCADALHCSLTGSIGITMQNPPQCAGLRNQGNVHPPTTTTILASPAVQAVAKVESKLASDANLKEASQNGGMACSGRGSVIHSYVNDIASTTDGGLTWTPDQLPSNVPSPQLSGLACPTAEECWASGSEEIFQQVGNASDADSSMLLGTTNGGQTWSKVTFSVPNSAPNYDGQSYLSIGLISCATANVCAAQGGAAQGSPTAPVYSLVIPSGGG